MKPRDIPLAFPAAPAAPFRAFDPFGAGEAFSHLMHAWLADPDGLLRAWNQLFETSAELSGYAWARVWGGSPAPVCEPVHDDDRFRDPAWQANALLDFLVQVYLGYSRWVMDKVFETPGVSDKTKRTAAFWVRQWIAAVSPSNFFWTNPVAWKRAQDTHGESVIRGLRAWLEDLRDNDLPMTETSGFVIGENIAATPGTVVFRDELMEVIRYTPTGDKVRAVPLVIIPPWINKFYILDLHPKKSLVRFLLNEGFDVFIVSWRNPTPEMAEITFDDYMFKGAQCAIEATRQVTGAPKVHAVGYCLGGTALSALLAWMNARLPKDEIPVDDWTLFTSMNDFADPGDILAFINEPSLATLHERMAKSGGLEGKDMAMAFRMLRPNSLLWNTVVHRYLYGEPLPAMDVLFWNVDSTRMPRAMHEFYLRHFYLENRLCVPGGVVLGGEPIDLGKISQPLYAVSAQEDHIAPWRSAFKTAGLVKSPVRFALSTSGHILGIVNPPVDPPKRAYWAGDATGCSDGPAWLAQQHQTPGSWWPDWAEWLHARSGEWKKPSRVPKGMNLEPAPGRYVRGE